MRTASARCFVWIVGTLAALSASLSFGQSIERVVERSDTPALSANGRLLAFRSDAADLVPGDSNGTSDVFVRDRITGATRRVSMSSQGVEGDGSSGLGGLSISANGRFVAFASDASNLVPGDTNNASDIFVHDRFRGTTERVSVTSDGQQGTASSFRPVLNADGRFVAFDSLANDLVPGDSILASDVFLHDRMLRTTELVSVTVTGEPPLPPPEDIAPFIGSDSPTISADGRLVTFQSSADLGIGTFRLNIYLRDRQAGTTRFIGGAFPGSLTFRQQPSISASGRFVGFFECEFGLEYFIQDLQTGVRETVASTATHCGDVFAARPALSRDGRFVAFTADLDGAPADDPVIRQDVFVFDRATGLTERISESAAGESANGESFAPVAISATGRFVAFASAADNLVPGDTNAAVDIFVRERLIASPEPAALMLTTDAATLPVSTESCATARVLDDAGLPIAGSIVEFQFNAGRLPGGIALADDLGMAQLCFASDLPGRVRIDAVALEGDGVADRASVLVLPPQSTSRCRVFYVGILLAANGRAAVVQGRSLVIGDAVRGDDRYLELAGRLGLRFDSTRLDALACAETSAAIFGEARLNDGASVGYRIDLVDGGAGRVGDRYRLRLTDGFDSGDQPFLTGFADVRSPAM